MEELTELNEPCEIIDLAKVNNQTEEICISAVLHDRCQIQKNLLDIERNN